MTPLIMRRYSGVILSLTLALALAGCLRDEDSSLACRYGVAQDLDNKRWEQALERLDSQACQRGMTREQRQIDRAAAHIGRAGYRLGDIIKVLLAPPQADEEASDLRYLRRLGGLGISPGALRELDLALREHQAMVAEFANAGGEGLLQQACRRENLHQLSPLQKDACFYAGLFAHVRFSKALTLLLDGEIAAWIGDQALDCDTDLSNTGGLDSAEISACALSAVGRLDEGGAVCIPATDTSGEVRWDRLQDYPTLQFSEGVTPLAELVPLEITVNPGASCSGRNAKRGYRLVKPSPGASLAITDGACRRDVNRACDPLDPHGDCWPCPVPRAGESGVQTVSNTLLEPVNHDAELMLLLLPGTEGDRLADRIEDSRERLCAPAQGTAAECEQRTDGRTIVNPAALEAYLRR